VTETATVDLLGLRKPFPPEQIGKLPRGNVQLDYVGHADVTDRLLSVDLQWQWQPAERVIDKDVLAAALATGDAAIIQQVMESFPPRFDLDRNGNPVGLWIKLTVGGVTRPGYGSCPSSQNDAVKVLIGDALRNAAMRFGVALDLWAKGDRDDPTAENATASAGRAERHHGAQSASDAFENAAPRRPASQGPRQESNGRSGSGFDNAAPAPEVPPKLEQGDEWAQRIDDVKTVEEADQAEGELRDLFKAGTITAERAKQVKYWLNVKAAPMRTAAKSAAGREPAGPAKPDEPTADAIAWCADFAGRLVNTPLDGLQAMRLEIGRAVRDKTITAEDGNALSSDVAKRRKELEQQAAAEGAVAA
jgi:hypothetical protein